MNTASLELCKELFELSGWVGVEEWFDHDVVAERAPAYTLDFLLRKLPETTTLRRNKRKAIKTSNWHGEWAVGVFGDKYKGISGTHGDTPEDAACKLAIELFKLGVLL